MMRRNFSRRRMLRGMSSGFGYLAFGALASAERKGLAVRPGHYPGTAKRVIFLCMKGAPSHVDTFDYKPELTKRDGERWRGGGKLLGSPFAFAQHGESGQWISELFPKLAVHADEMCVMRGMHTDLPNHSQAFTQMHTGSFQFVRPSLGSWVLYGLGSENENLPGYISLNPPPNLGGAKNYGSAFMPAVYQGTRIGGGMLPPIYQAFLGKAEEPGPPLKHVERRSGLSLERQRGMVDLVQGMDRRKLAREGVQPEVEGAIASMELAFRMQAEVPEALDFGAESEATLTLYGLDREGPHQKFSSQCLMARRLVEAGVRFVEVTAPVDWDQHFRLKESLRANAGATDAGMAGLLADLKLRGMLEDTLVMWGGEFGRTPYGQGVDGRDHNHKGFTMWMAGGGVRGGRSLGATDEVGYEAVDGAMHVRDWHATVLHLMGLDHERLTYGYGGREFRLTDIGGKVFSI